MKNAGKSKGGTMRLGQVTFGMLLVLSACTALADDPIGALQLVVEVEEEVYTYEPAANGAGPMWCFGNTSIVRLGETVFASRLETLSKAKPLNNCVASLLHRTAKGWKEVYRDSGRTREPSPLAACPAGQIYLSLNPTLTPPDTYSGPAQPGVMQFEVAKLDEPPQSLAPVWEGEPDFSEHSYRSFAVDGEHGAMILLQNVGYTHAEWSFRDRAGNWSAQGKLAWPSGAAHDSPGPIRVCYPTVAIDDRRVVFCGVSDIIEPNEAWRAYKKELTGRKWDYDFRRLFFCWSDDIATGVFHDWVEVASREKTAGQILPNDLYVAPNGDVFVLWTERALDERLQAKFFPNAEQRVALECAILRDGKVRSRTTLVAGTDDGFRPGRGRFHVGNDGQLYVIYYLGGKDAEGKRVAENRIAAIDTDGNVSQSLPVALKQPLASFFTATVRAGCAPSNLIDIFGNVGTTMRYARIRLR